MGNNPFFSSFARLTVAQKERTLPFQLFQLILAKKAQTLFPDVVGLSKPARDAGPVCFVVAENRVI
jgi:hypothetical protein